MSCHNQKGCNQESCHQCGCSSCDCSCHQEEKCCHSHETFAHTLLELADEAWMEVLKEKIKQQILQNGGSRLDELAKLISDSNEHRWKNKIAADKGVQNFKSEINQFFGGSGECCKG